MCLASLCRGLVWTFNTLIHVKNATCRSIARQWVCCTSTLKTAILPSKMTHVILWCKCNSSIVNTPSTLLKWVLKQASSLFTHKTKQAYRSMLQRCLCSGPGTFLCWNSVMLLVQIKGEKEDRFRWAPVALTNSFVYLPWVKYKP